MNIKRKANGGFSRISDEVLLTRALTVLQAMTGNPFFAAPNPDLSILDNSINDYQSRWALARRKGSPMDTAAKNATRQQLSNVLQQLAFYVNTTAEGDLQQLLSSGFDLSTPPKLGDVPDSVTGLKLSDGKQSGQLRLDFNKQSMVLLYEYRFSHQDGSTADTDWSAIFNTTTSRNNIIAPLPPFVRCYVQVRAVNGYGKSEWSERSSHVPR